MERSRAPGPSGPAAQPHGAGHPGPSGPAAQPHGAGEPSAPAPDDGRSDLRDVTGALSSYGPSQADFERLYRTEFSAIVSVVHSLTGRRDVAEEITQDAFVVTHDRWKKVSAYDRPADFVRRVALNRALSSLRRRQAEHRALERWQGRNRPADQPLSGGDEWGLWAAVRRLPDRQAKAVALMYVEDQSVERIAQILSCSENTVKTHLKRARAALSSTLAAGQAGAATRWGVGHG